MKNSQGNKTPESGLAKALAEAKAGTEEAARHSLVEVVFLQVRQQRLAVPVANVSEVLRPSRITPLPRLPEHILGIINRSGRVVAVLDVGRYAGLESEQTPTRFVVLFAGDLDAAVPVTSVDSIESVETARIQPALPNIVARAPYLDGQIEHQGRVYSLVDVERLLSNGSGNLNGASGSGGANDSKDGAVRRGT